MRYQLFRALLGLGTGILISCRAAGPPATAFTGATIITGTDAAPIDNGVLIVQGGRITAVGSAADVAVPSGADVVDLTGRFITPGLINAHGHVGGVLGLEDGHYTEENLRRQLRLYAAYGVTTVASLGGDGDAGFALREAQSDTTLDRARIFVAGEVVTGTTPQEAVAMVNANLARGVNFIKIRVDDNLGTSPKMTPEVYQAVIDRAHGAGTRVASHLYYLDDAKALLRAGTGFVAHSIRDRPVDDEVISLFRETGVCYSPTLTREVSTFVYESEPDFFSDPFFLAHADPAVLDQLRSPDMQAQYRESASAQVYKKALTTASANLKALSDAGVTIAMGTDTGPPARFQGYFEHMEMRLMQEAGMSPAQILRAATSDAARCLGLPDVGVVEPGAWADFVVVSADPLQDITNLRQIESVWIAGSRFEDR